MTSKTILTAALMVSGLFSSTAFAIPSPTSATKTVTPIQQMNQFLSRYCTSLIPVDRDAVSSLRVDFCTGFTAKPRTYGQLSGLMSHIAAKTGEAARNNPQLMSSEKALLIELQNQANEYAGNYLFKEVNQAFNSSDM